jgi:hypothetical protein
MRTSVNANVIVGLTTTRSHAAMIPMPPADRAVDRCDHRRCDGAETVDCPHERGRVDHPGSTFLQVGAGAEDRGV